MSLYYQIFSCIELTISLNTSLYTAHLLIRNIYLYCRSFWYSNIYHPIYFVKILDKERWLP